MANKKRRASAARPASAAPPQPQSQPPASGRVGLFVNTLRMVALLSATAVAVVVVYELLQTSLGFWPALGIGFAVGVVARVAFVWLERVWVRAAARRALAQAARRADQ